MRRSPGNALAWRSPIRASSSGRVAHRRHPLPQQGRTNEDETMGLVFGAGTGFEPYNFLAKSVERATRCDPKAGDRRSDEPSDA